MNKGVNNSIPEDTISRAAAIDALDKCHCGGKDENGRPWIYKENAVEAIEMVEPSPQIIRCKDCEYWERWNTFEGQCMLSGDGEIREEHYCGYAKRRLNENLY